MVAKYQPVLSAPGSLRLLTSALLARLPQGMSSLVILLLVRGATHSYAAAGIAVGGYALATAAFAPVQGRLVDRYGRGRVLLPFAFAQLVVYLALALTSASGTGAPTLIALSTVAGALLPTIAPVVRALLRDLFDDPVTRDTAYSFEAIIQELVWIAGPLVVALVVSLASPRAAIVLLGVVCALGTSLFVRSPLVGGRTSGSGRGKRVPAISSRGLRALLVPIALTGTGLGAIEVGLPSLALHAGSRPASGLLLALWSLGSMLGGLWYGSRVWSSELADRYRVLLVLLVVCTAPLIAARSIAAGVVCSVLAGISIAPVFSCQYALVSNIVTPGSETEAFTWVSAALVGGLAAGSAVGGAVIGVAGVSGPFMVSGLALALAAVSGILSTEQAQPASL